ncbi:MAG: hypothetical protein J3R72DRAFT_438289 [Linnemannia gamsii]|nr:MAG: hypothetical protein J3R72DRAFT_438289 [Linnemannia gamsii]
MMLHREEVKKSPILLPLSCLPLFLSSLCLCPCFFFATSDLEFSSCISPIVLSLPRERNNRGTILLGLSQFSILFFSLLFAYVFGC